AGSLARNGFGLYDVHGNVAEMVADCYDAGGSGSSCTRRVVRGGSWASAPRLLRSAYRSWCAPTLRSPQTGFRIARNL
ncbi:MAG: SUMF1/EgtB/PvdO family nonheme iron enzyme, partial [Spirochaetaceae bacterium]|nr:SUMF1/EgtB/PvdO family nonheme iron enzyme [Spirochaetaceae bacterium]